MRTYTFGYSRLKKAEGTGFHVRKDGSIKLSEEEPVCRIYLKALDGMENSLKWGRLILKASLDEGSILTVYAAAGRHGKEISIGPFVNQTDILLCELTGRYLWIWMEIQNAAGGVIHSVRVENSGMEILEMLPEVYRERGSVLHRYLSVFYSMYTDFQRTIDGLGGLLEVEHAPASTLPILGEWLGIQIGEGLLTEQMTRQLLRKAAYLGSIRGTKKVMKELALLLSGEEPSILEKENGTVVLLFRQNVSEELELRLLYFLMQFLPKECRLHIVSHQAQMGMDEYCLMDVGFVQKAWEIGAADTEEALDMAVMG